MSLVGRVDHFPQIHGELRVKMITLSWSDNFVLVILGMIFLSWKCYKLALLLVTSGNFTSCYFYKFKELSLKCYFSSE